MVVEEPVDNHRRVGDEAAVDFQRRHHVGDHPLAVGAVGRPGLAEDAGLHCPFIAEQYREEVGGAADRRRAVLGARLAEAGQVLRDGEVAGHADLLAAADAHSVDAADHRLVAGEDAAHHVVEEAEVLPVFLRIARVILRIFLGIAAGAERPVAGAGEDHADHVARVGSGAEGEDHLLDHRGGVRVELRLVVEDDPGVVQALGDGPVRAPRRPLLEAHRGGRASGDVGYEVVVLHLDRGCGLVRHDLAPWGTRIARRVERCW